MPHPTPPKQDRLLTEDELSEWLQRPTRTLRQWRYSKTGPPFITLVGQIRYSTLDVQAWLDAHRTAPEEIVPAPVRNRRVRI